MDNPYYLHTPRNIFGEPLTGDSIHNPPYQIRTIHSGKIAHAEGRNRDDMLNKVKELNYGHATLLCEGAFI